MDLAVLLGQQFLGLVVQTSASNRLLRWRPGGSAGHASPFAVARLHKVSMSNSKSSSIVYPAAALSSSSGSGDSSWILNVSIDRSLEARSSGPERPRWVTIVRGIVE